jgi:hypothetical protein
MAKNLSREFATMSDDERRRFALERGESQPEPAGDELDLDEPRDEDQMGRHYASLEAEVADPDARDGEAALLDDEAHRRNEQRARRDSGRGSKAR